jgi:hypothetical protein
VAEVVFLDRPETYLVTHGTSLTHLHPERPGRCDTIGGDGYNGTVRHHDGEPDFGPGVRLPVAAVVGELMDGRRPQRRPFVLAIDGRSSNGKTHLAERIVALVPRTAVVHTDDVAWNHSRFGWDDLVLSGVIEPLRRGEAVDYRPPAWDARGRPGSIWVAADAGLVVVEGVGAGRASLAAHVDAVIWVQSDPDVVECRSRARVDAGEIDAAGYEGWMSEEVPFQARERTWERADLVVSGSATLDDPTGIVVLRS